MTVRLTETVPAVPPVGVIVIVPLYVPTANPLVFTVTVRMAGVVPEVGDIESQFPPLTAEAKERSGGVLETARVCDGGTAPPDCAVNVRLVGEKVMLGVPMVRFTGTVTGLFEAVDEVRVIVPPYDPGVRLPGVQKTETELGVLPVHAPFPTGLVPITLSQPPELVADTVNVMAPPLLVTFSDCGKAGAELPAKLKVTFVGETINCPTACAADVTLRVTIQVSVFPDVIVTMLV